MYYCKFCSRECINLKSLSSHERLCPKNPERNIEHTQGMKGKTGWNKGLTKETDERVDRNAKNIGIATNGKNRAPLSYEHKLKISISMKQFFEENPSRVPYLLNHSSKISYPEQYFIECFRKLEYSFQYTVFRYKLDFANISEKLYFEVDGDQHYTDKKMVEHDKKRTAKLSEFGWKCIRIRWSEFQKLSYDERERKINEIISFMKFGSIV